MILANSVKSIRLVVMRRYLGLVIMCMVVKLYELERRRTQSIWIMIVLVNTNLDLSTKRLRPALRIKSLHDWSNCLASLASLSLLFLPLLFFCQSCFLCLLFRLLLVFLPLLFRLPCLLNLGFFLSLFR